IAQLTAMLSIAEFGLRNSDYPDSECGAAQRAPSTERRSPNPQSAIRIPQLPRLVTLTGPGGTGKTRLALEVAGRLLEPFSGAVWFVPLGDLSDPQLIAGAIADALRIPRSPDSAPLEQAVEALSRQASLLVPDHLEELV